jgi:hypothetical protein
VATAQVFPLASNTQAPCVIGIPGNVVLEGKSFVVRAEGNLYSAGATTTANFTLLGGLSIPATPLTAANWTTVKAGTAATVNTTWAPWWMDARLIYDSQSGLLQGTFQQVVNNVLTATVAIAGVLTGLNGTNLPVVQGASTIQPADPVAYLALALTFSAAGANIGNLMNFELGF